ncbi:hypothetical protein M0804_007003 [Polistes exclamans]|nr:hypothetical protein M0804_007003 [Polistes exclamans]
MADIHRLTTQKQTNGKSVTWWWFNVQGQCSFWAETGVRQDGKRLVFKDTLQNYRHHHHHHHHHRRRRQQQQQQHQWHHQYAPPEQKDLRCKTNFRKTAAFLLCYFGGRAQLNMNNYNDDAGTATAEAAATAFVLTPFLTVMLFYREKLRQ